MKTIDYSYFIERFNAGEMSETEKEWFLRELEGNEKLRNEVNLRKHADEILKNQNVISLRNKFKKTTFIKYAAVFTGIILIGSVLLFSGKNLNNEKIMKSYYKVYEPPTGQRSVQSATDLSLIHIS